MIGFKDDYEYIEKEYAIWGDCLSFYEWVFYAFGMEPNSAVDRSLGLAAKKQKSKEFALELLESGELVFEMSEKYRKL